MQPVFYLSDSHNIAPSRSTMILPTATRRERLSRIAAGFLFI
nr:MAG TPA: hypothetical protein [Caudoviricetes sp.]